MQSHSVIAACLVQRMRRPGEQNITHQARSHFVQSAAHPDSMHRRCTESGYMYNAQLCSIAGWELARLFGLLATNRCRQSVGECRCKHKSLHVPFVAPYYN